MNKRAAASGKIAIYCLLDPLLHSELEENMKKLAVSKSEYIRWALRSASASVSRSKNRIELGRGTK